jgi:hypothetical protein
VPGGSPHHGSLIPALVQVTVPRRIPPLQLRFRGAPRQLAGDLSNQGRQPLRARADFRKRAIEPARRPLGVRIGDGNRRGGPDEPDAIPRGPQKTTRGSRSRSGASSRDGMAQGVLRGPVRFGSRVDDPEKVIREHDDLGGFVGIIEHDVPVRVGVLV